MTSPFSMSGCRAKSDALVVIYGGTVTTLDPHKGGGTILESVNRNIYECLVRRSQDMRALEPALATAWHQVDPLTMQFTQTFPIPVIEGRICSPHGIDLGARHELLIGCSLAGTNVETLIMNASTGTIVKVFTEVGASDQVWFNRGDRKYYLAARNFPGGAVLGVIDSEDNSWLLNMPTAPNAHSVAASRRDDHVFVPLTPLPSDPDCVTGCIGVYGDDDKE